MWIGFESRRRYAIKIFVGGINAISGESAVPNAATSLRRRNLIKQGKSVQDYVVVGSEGQKWLDGVAVEPGSFAVLGYSLIPSVLYGTGSPP